jgi:hypothetical protein
MKTEDLIPYHNSFIASCSQIKNLTNLLTCDFRCPQPKHYPGGGHVQT